MSHTKQNIFKWNHKKKEYGEKIYFFVDKWISVGGYYLFKVTIRIYSKNNKKEFHAKFGSKSLFFLLHPRIRIFSFFSSGEFPSRFGFLRHVNTPLSTHSKIFFLFLVWWPIMTWPPAVTFVSHQKKINIYILIFLLLLLHPPDVQIPTQQEYSTWFKICWHNIKTGAA